MKKFFWLAIVLGAIRCGEDPVGFDELGRGKEPLTAFTSFATDRGSYGDYIPTGAGEYLVCGKDTSYEARMALQFYFSDSIADSLDSLKLLLYSNTDQTDTLVTFSVYLLSESWYESQATWLLSNSVNRWIKPGGDYDSVALAAGRFGPDSTVVNLFGAREKLAGHNCYGIILVANNTGFATMYSSYTASKSPKLLVYQKGKSEQRLSPLQDCYFVNSVLGDIPAGELWVGSGYAYRSYLRFDLDSIPPFVRITSAELAVGVKNIVAPTDTLVLAVHKLNGEWDGQFTDYDLTAVTTKQFTKSDTVVVFDIRGLVQSWVDSTKNNYGLLITFSSESNTISRLELVPASDSALQPRLRGSYVKPPTPRF